MILILDNIINNLSNISSVIVLLSVVCKKKYNFLIIFIIDIILYKIPIISISLIVITMINILLLKKIINKKFNRLIILILDYFIFITFIYLFNNCDLNYLLFIKNNYISHLFNILIYYIYIYYC